ncbi:amidohydrolase, partial [Streptomyces sp. JV178]
GRVLYAMDYPYQYAPDEVTAQDDLPLGTAGLKAFFQTTAEDLFQLR